MDGEGKIELKRAHRDPSLLRRMQHTLIVVLEVLIAIFDRRRLDSRPIS